MRKGQQDSTFSRAIIFYALALAAAGGNAAHAEGTTFGAEAGPLVSVPPAVGFRFGRDDSKFTLALPWSVQFGPLWRGDAGDGLRPFRALLEPGIAIPTGGGANNYFLRLGLRRLASTKGMFGFGVGAGYTQSLSKRLISALSQEVLITLGRCCSPGSVFLSVRYEYSFSGQGELWTSLGFGLW